MASIKKRAAARPSTVPTVKLDASGHITEDLPCRHCGYNLRTLSTKVRCPECGTAVARSVHGDYLRFADPSWVRGLATGAMLILVALILQVLVAGITIWLQFANANNPKWAGVINIGITFMGGIGFWLMASADPSSTEKMDRQSPRRKTRILLVVWFCIVMSSPLRRGLIAVVHYSTDILILTVSIGFSVTMQGCLIALLRRIPDESLARSCRRFTVFLIAIMSYREFWDSISIFGAGSEFVRANRMNMLYLIMLLSIFKTAWVIRLAFRLRSAFATAAQLAQKTRDGYPPKLSSTKGGVP